MHNAKLNLQHWIEANKEDLKPPVSNKQLFAGVAQDVILFVSGGPNTRNDYHVNPTEELFYQLKGDIAVRLRPDGRDRDAFIAMGAQGQGAIYTERGQLIHIVRRVILRVGTKLDWLVLKLH